MRLNQKIISKKVWELLGGISDMSLWHFLHYKKLESPKPISINRRRFWSNEELKQWLEQRPKNNQSNWYKGTGSCYLLTGNGLETL